MEKNKEIKKVGRPTVNEKTRDLVVRLYKEDEMTCSEIATACNISMSSVFRIMRKYKKGAVNG